MSLVLIGLILLSGYSLFSGVSSFTSDTNTAETDYKPSTTTKRSKSPDDRVASSKSDTTPASTADESYTAGLEVPGFPEDVTYTTIEEDVVPPYKRSMDVRLSEKVSKDALSSLATRLKASDPQTYEKTFICYYLPGMAVDSRAWATTHFSPDLNVKILGLSAEEEKRLTATAKDSTREPIGVWLDDQHPIPSRITFFHADGQLRMERQYPDGTVGTFDLIERSVGEFKVFMDAEKCDLGEHDVYFINDRGELETWSLDVDDTYGDKPVFTARQLKEPNSDLVPSDDTDFASALQAEINDPKPPREGPSEKSEKSAIEECPGGYREWTDVSGKFNVKAALIGRADDTVRLKKMDGSTVTVPIEQLSEEDRKFLEQD